MFAPPVLQVLSGARLHLSHGPIDIVLKAWGTPEAVQAAYAAAWARFPHILPELCAELGELRRPMSEHPRVTSPVARRMHAACVPFAGAFVTPMAAVAGAVADELLAEMMRAAPLARAFVNDGGDIAVHVTPGAPLEIGVAGAFKDTHSDTHEDTNEDTNEDRAHGGLEDRFKNKDLPRLNGRVAIAAGQGIGGIATSGARGRSLSLGIADAVTTLARDAATADVAATLVANAVALDAQHPLVTRRPAHDLDPDSDLGARLVTTAVGRLAPDDIVRALDAGRVHAEALRQRGLIHGAALMLQGHTHVAGGVAHLLQAGLLPRAEPDTPSGPVAVQPLAGARSGSPDDGPPQLHPDRIAAGSRQGAVS